MLTFRGQRYLRMVHGTVGIHIRESPGGETDCHGRMDHPIGAGYGQVVNEGITGQPDRRPAHR
jgi:hypothetical protein